MSCLQTHNIAIIHALPDVLLRHLLAGTIGNALFLQSLHLPSIQIHLLDQI